MFCLRWSICFFVSCFLSGCISSTYVKTEGEPVGRSTGIIIMGIEANGVPYNGGLTDLISAPTVTMEKREYSEGSLSGQTILPYSANVEDGYVIFELPETSPEERYALGYYKRGPASQWNYGINCFSGQSEVYPVEAGQVVYIGNYKLHSFKATMQGVSWRVDKEIDLEAAISHLKDKHRELADRVVQSSPQLATVNVGSGCND